MEVLRNISLDKKRRTALYARVSTADQASGLESQIRALTIFCEQNKIKDYELFADENQSGTKSSRPGLDRMMNAVEGGEIDTVVVFAFSRYARSVSHMLKGLEIFKKHKTNFISLTEKLDLNTSLGHVVFVIISAIAQLERDLIAERVKNGLANARAKGRQIGRLRKRNTVLINSLLDAGLTYREIARIAKCSHGSVHAQKKELLAQRAEAERKRLEELNKPHVIPETDTQSLSVNLPLIQDQNSNAATSAPTINTDPQTTLIRPSNELV